MVQSNCPAKKEEGRKFDNSFVFNAEGESGSAELEGGIRSRWSLSAKVVVFSHSDLGFFFPFVRNPNFRQPITQRIPR